MITVAECDVSFLKLIRESVDDLLKSVSTELRVSSTGLRVLDIAPQDHSGISPHLAGDSTLLTLDIDASSGADIIADLCLDDGTIPSDSFDVIACTEVLEHVANPFAAVAHIRRILRPGGLLLASSPLNFRIHGPLPDNWRFTEHGWRALLEGFSSLEIRSVETPDRPLMPIHYAVRARL